jgi:hypothetical protein
VMDRLTGVVTDTTLWPHVNPSDSTIILDDTHNKLLASLDKYHKGDENSPLYTRSERVLTYWDLFTKAIKAPNDTTYWNILKRQIQQDRSLYAADISPAETRLGDKLQEHEVKEVKKVIAQQTAFEFSDEIVTNVNDNPSAEYRLDRAVRELRNIKAKLDPSDIEHRKMIDNYLSEAKSWSRIREYKGKVETLPGETHIHIAVTDAGEDPAWTDINQIYQGNEFSFKWKPGQDIHIAADTGSYCQLGKNPSDKVVLSGKYALFDMEKPISFDNIGKKLTIRFSPALVDRLPKLE